MVSCCGVEAPAGLPIGVSVPTHLWRFRHTRDSCLHFPPGRKETSSPMSWKLLIIACTLGSTWGTGRPVLAHRKLPVHFINMRRGPGELAQPVKVLAAEPAGLSSIPGTCVVGRENQRRRRWLSAQEHRLLFRTS